MSLHAASWGIRVMHDFDRKFPAGQLYAYFSEHFLVPNSIPISLMKNHSRDSEDVLKSVQVLNKRESFAHVKPCWRG